MKNNKKGISAIVATVLIILITVAAVTIIWAAIIPMIQNNLAEGTACLDAVSQVQIKDSGYTCFNSSANVTLIQVSRGAGDFVLQDIQILAYSGGNSISNKTLISELAGGAVPNPNEERVYILNSTRRDVNVNASLIDQVTIAPIVGVGASQKTCDISSTKTIRAC